MSVESFLKKPVAERKKIAEKGMENHPGRYPVLLVPRGDVKLKSFKLMINDVPFNRFLVNIRGLIEGIGPMTSIFVLVNDRFYAGSQLMSTIYEKNKAADHFLYCHVSLENTFG